MNPTFAYVALVYLAFVFLWRRMATPLPWRVAIFFYLLVLVFLWDPLTGPFVNVPADYLSRLYPWRGMPGDLQNRNPEMNDVILQMAPWSNLVREAWQSLQFPLWNPSAGGGYPLLANGQSAALSPFRLLGLPLNLGHSMTFEAALKILLAMTFTYALARRRLSEAASLVASVAFGFSTFIVVWLHFPHSAVTALLPAVFLSIELLFEKVTIRRTVGLTLAFAVLLVGGHPESAAHVVFAGALLMIWKLVTGNRNWRAVGAVAVAGIAALIVAAPFVFPLIEALPRSQRFQWLRDQPVYREPAALNVLVPFLHVDFYGSIRTEDLWGPGIAEMLCGFAGILGWVGWWSVILTFRRWRESWRHPAVFLALALPLVISIALAWPVAYDLFEMLPLFSMAANGRLRLVACLLLALLAGEAVDRFRREPRRMRLAVGLAALSLLIPFFTSDFPTQYHFEKTLFTSIPRWLVLIAALVATFRFVPKRAAALLVLSVTVLDLWSFGRSWNPVVPEREFYPATPLIRFLQGRAEVARRNRQPFRIAGMSSALFPNSAGMYGLEDIRSHDPMSNGRLLGVLRVFTGYSSQDYFGMLRSMESPFLDYLNVRYVMAAPSEELDARWRRVYSGRDGAVFENTAVLPRFFAARIVLNEFDDEKRMRLMLEHNNWGDEVILKRLPKEQIGAVRNDLFRRRPPGSPEAKVVIRAASGDHFTLDVSAPRWTLIVSSQPNWPGWKVYRNGKERLKIIEVNEGFVGFLVPPGRSAVSVAYEPRSFSVSLVISLAMLLLLAAACLWEWLRSRRSPAAAASL